jgi:hypothetical protein
MTKASYNADQLETFARSFSSRSFKCRMPEPVSFSAGEDRKQTGCGSETFLPMFGHSLLMIPSRSKFIIF